LVLHLSYPPEETVRIFTVDSSFCSPSHLCPPARPKLRRQLARAQPGNWLGYTQVQLAPLAWGERRGKRQKMLQADAIGEEEIAAQLAHPEVDD